MGRRKIKACKICGATDKPLSKRKLCIDCAMKRQLDNIRQIRNKSGHYYELWLAGIALAAAKAADEVERRQTLLPDDETNKNSKE